MRPSTNFEPKRLELIKIAWRLFVERGYERTSIQNIIAAAGISKGAMYHYFNSKEEILDAVLQHMVAEEFKEIEAIIDNPSMSAAEKFMWLMFRPPSEEAEQAKELTLREHDSLLDYRARELNRQASIPIFKKIIEQGIAEGTFETEYPEEMATFCQYIMGDVLTSIVMSGDEIKINNMLGAVEVFMKKCLHTSPEALHYWNSLFKEKGM